MLDLFPEEARSLPTLSLWQPWASALMFGSKGPETRGWPCPPRLIGKTLAIHAAKRRPCLCEIGDDFEEVCLNVTGYGWDRLPLGCVLGTVRVLKVYRTDDLVERNQCLSFGSDGRPLRELEYMLGDYSPGRFAWDIEVIERFDEPIPAKGMQGIWQWTPAPSHVKDEQP